MNRLVELADSLHTIARYLIPLGSPGLAEIAKEAAALLRAAACEPVGTEWEACFAGYLVHNAEITAARLAVANAKAERDDALGALRDEKALHKSIAAERDAALARVRDREAELLRCRTHETAAAHELDCKLNPEERAEFKRTADALAAALARVAELERANSSAPLTGSPPAATPAATPQEAGVSPAVSRELVAMAMVPHMFNQMCHGVNSGQFGWPEDWRYGLVADAFKFADEFIAEARRGGAE